MVLMGIELHSIDFVPEHERHGRVQDQGPFWFLSNFHFFAIAIGFVGPSLGLSLGATSLAGALVRTGAGRPVLTCIRPALTNPRIPSSDR
jgi:purine-cytosine permease-like protein